MEILALITARGGSKTIPHKNIMSFHGKPLIAWSIEAAVNSKSISRVITSTDNLDIRYVAGHIGRTWRQGSKEENSYFGLEKNTIYLGRA